MLAFMRTKLICLATSTLLYVLPFLATGQTNGFTIPTGHPRLWWNAERIQKTKDYYAAHPFTIDTDLNEELALGYVLTGNVTYARKAINSFMNFIQTEPGADPMRWEGEKMNLVYDWCYDQMTVAERNIFLQKWSEYIENSNNLSWGNVGMEENNYYQGYLRNGLEWGITTFNENPKAQYFLDHALITRWENSYIPWAQTKGRGGVPEEGTQYGRYQMNYQYIPIATIGLLGRNMLRENPFYREALFSTIYSTSHIPMYTKDNAIQPYYQLFQFSDDQFGPFTKAADIHYGNILTMVANEWKDVPLGKYGRHWLKKVNCPRDFIVKALDEDTPSMDFSSLPLDYYAPGFRSFYLNTSWDDNATSTLLQFGRQTEIKNGHYFVVGDHNHYDWGSFQIRRGSRWLTRETSDYDFNLKVGFQGNGLSQCRRTLHHNGIVFTGRGWTKGMATGYQLGPSNVTRLESQPDYAYAAVDLSLTYQAEKGTYIETLPGTGEPVPRDDNPFAKTVIREFIFIRKLETLIVFDRLESKEDTYYGNVIPTNPNGTAPFPAEQVIKTFLLHSQTQPQITNNEVLIRNVDQELKVTTLVPATPSYNVVEDGNSSDPLVDRDPSWYQYRIEASTTGTAQSYFLNVLQARDVNGQELTIDFTENATSYNVVLTHPTLGKAVVLLEKGMVSTGGLIGYTPTGEPLLAPLTNSVADISVTDNGPVWGVQPVAAPAYLATIMANDNSATEPNTPGQFTIMVNPKPSANMTINLSHSGSATPGIDYNNLPATVTVGTSGTAIITVTPTDDAIIEGNETAILTLQAGAGYAIGIANVATVTITDNDEPNTVPNITTTTLPNASTATNYLQQLMATGGNGTLQWALVSPTTLPPGIGLLPSGILSGTPTTEGSYNFSVKVTDSDANNTASDEDIQAYTINVIAPDIPPVINTTTLQAGTVGITYSQSLNATGGNKTLHWSVVSTASLPPGITISNAGVISGVPTTAGTYNFTVKVADGDANNAASDEDTQAYSIVVAEADLAPAITSSTLPSGDTDTVYSQTLSASNGNGTLIWSLVSGTFPPGIALSDAGIISGTPTSSGTFIVTIKVMDSDANNTVSDEDVETLTIIIEDIKTDDIPVYLSPNNDAVHDLWEWRNINKYIDCELVVFSRSGQEVFRAKPYENNWDGTYKGRPLAQGDYYYILKYSDGKIKKGALRIIR